MTPFEDIELLQQLPNPEVEQLNELQASLDLHKGPLLRAAQLSETKLLLIVHHMAVDWVSWATLLSDLEFAYKQLQNTRPVAFPHKTTSFKAWGERLSEWANSKALQSELGYWQGLAWDQVKDLAVDHPGADNTETNNKLYTLQLNTQETSGILQGLANRYRVAPRDVVLTAVAVALAQHTNSQSVLIDLEGHGREDLFDDIDLTRTVGWFTSLYPVVLQLPADQSAVNTLPAVRDQLAALPNNGIGYGVLRYFTPGSGLAEQTRQADVSFNYLGNIDQVAGSNSMFTMLNEARGLEHSRSNERPHKIDINCMISEGQLYINLGFSSKLFNADTIAALASKVETELRQLIAIGDNGSGLRSTPASFPLAQLNQTELDSLLPDDKPVDDIYPLTPLQQGMLFHSLLDNSSDVYLASFNWLLEGRLDVPLFEKAWNLIINQHSSLRSATQWQGIKTPVQVVYDNVSVPFDVEDWTNFEPLEQEARLAKWFNADRNKRFDLASAPLTRVTLLQMGDTTYRMIWSFHHMIMDGWSVPLVIREVFSAYEALAKDQTPKLIETRPFSDYISWLLAQDQTVAQEYWRKSMQGFTAPTRLPGADLSDAAQNAAPDYEEVHFGLPPAAGNALKAFAQQHRLTVNTITQGAWALLLSRYSGEEDVVFGATTAGRPAQLEGIESMVGLFLNTLPVRIGIDEKTDLLTWLQQLQDQQLNIQQYEYASLVDIQGWSDVPRGKPLFETLLAFENYPDIETMGQTSGSINIKESSGFDRTNFPLTLNIAMMDTLYLRLVYDRNLFSSATLQRLGEHLQTLLTNIPEAAGNNIAEVSMLNPAEVEQFDQWNETTCSYPKESTLVSLLAQQASATPDALALSYGKVRLSYREVEQRSNQLAHYLRLQGISGEALIGVCMDRSIDMVISLLAIVKSGGAYVPMDPEYPTQRLQHMAEDAQLRLLLSHSAQQDIAETLNLNTIMLDEIRDELTALPTQAPEVKVMPGDLAYIIFTSGSTGRPKGVMNEHRGIVNRLNWMQDEYPLNHTDRVLQKTPFSFDVSVWEFFWPLITGAELIIAKPGGHRDSTYLAEIIKTQQITTTHFVPSMLQVFLQDAASTGCSSLKRVFCSGEALPYDLQRRFFMRIEGAALHNLYGPTEAAIDVTYWNCERDTKERIVPIGHPTANTKLYVVDNSHKRVALGVPGELWISGVQVARGYVNRPELTAERFIADPFTTGNRVYRTGDLVRLREDGAVEFLGRIDHQVKLRGFRIELGEIEAQLDQLTDVSQSVVLLREDTPGLPQLVAYVRASADFDETETKAALSTLLPDYMLPAAYVELSEIPVTANGKIDRRALPAPTLPQSKEEYIAPETEVERQLAVLWSELLGVEKVGTKDDFFALGGHSLIAMQLISRITELTSVQLPLDSVFNAPTLEELAKLLGSQGSGDDSDDKIVRIDRSSRRKRR
ncbi:MAG: amino acid adenylation domain-containing protein [Gammaproteobacteria bacterium]|nr:amino acid adenylation domain-containing protein [Gammaproteobacteria bacterium]